MLSTTASNARPAAALGISADAAMASISSVLFTLNPFRFICFRNTLAQANCYVGHLPCTTGAANELRFIPTDTIWVKETLLLYSTEQPNCLYFGQLGHSLSIHAGCSHASVFRMLPVETTVAATETYHQCVLTRLALSSFLACFCNAWYSSSDKGVGICCNAICKTSSIHCTGLIVRSSLILSGISLRSRSFSDGMITVLIPPRWAASNFSLRPPIRNTSPRKVISPVIATSALTGIPVSTDTSAVHIAIPALGPSLGVAPSGTWMWISTFSW